MIKTVIFDLDDTLVDTHLLRSLRAERNWSLIAQRLDSSTIFPGVLELLDWLRSEKLVSIAVVTNSPRKYAESLIKHHKLSVDCLVCYGDTRYAKPAPDLIDKAVKLLKSTPSKTISIGDRCIDVESSRSAAVKSIGVLWGHSNQRDLILSEPDFLVKKVSELKELLEDLCEGGSSGSKSSIIGADYWIDAPEWDYRQYLRGLQYHFVYHYYKGNWATSRANRLVLNLKGKTPQTRSYKVQAAALYARDLSVKIPRNSNVIFVQPAAKKGSSEYDDRWELVESQLSSIRPDLYFIQCVETTESSTPSHLQDVSSQDRIPSVIKTRLDWTRSPPDCCENIVVVDDVVTKGGHLAAYHQIITENHPDTNVMILAWAAFTSKTWYESPNYSTIIPEVRSQRSIRSLILSNEGELFTHSYSQTSRTFKVFNLPEKEQNCFFIEGVLKKILHRSQSLIPSKYIVDELKGIAQLGNETQNEFIILCDLSRVNRWDHTILGGDNSNPALEFYKRLEKVPLIQSLIYPECPLEEIFTNLDKKFTGQKVDFYLPQARLVIEFDGFHHNEVVQQQKDLDRDRLLMAAGIEVHRICSSDKAGARQLVNKLELIGETENFQKYKQSASIVFNNIENREIILTLISRLQVVLSELIIRDRLKWGEQWNLQIFNADIPESKHSLDWVRIAIKDLFNVREALAELNSEDLPWVEPRIEYLETLDLQRSNSNSLTIDISVLSKWDEQTKSDDGRVIVRSHYIERTYVNSDKGYTHEAADHYQHISSPPQLWNLDINSKFVEKTLQKLLSYLFGYDEFNPGQLEIISHSLTNSATAGLLATGGGKSLCFQMANLLQSGTCVIVCPIKALMFDQADELQRIGVHRTCYINSDVTGRERANIMDKVGRGKYHFVFVAPERFQTREFRDLIVHLSMSNQMSGFVVDEAHCMSEWGHDFRVSYLNLASTLRKVAPSLQVMLLTATASSSVLEDLKIEFRIDDDQVVAPAPPNRKELEFRVVSCENSSKRFQAIPEIIKQAREERGGSGMVFCPYVNGDEGVFNLAKNLKLRDNDYEVYFYSGSQPRGTGNIKDFDRFKKKTQHDFKKDKDAVLVTTKAFGMGVNKKDVNFTIHSGMPLSMEALYQEAGRAGRAKQPSNCYVLFVEEKTPMNVWYEPNLSASELQQSLKIAKYLKGDFLGQMYFLINNEKSIDDHATNISKLAIKVLSEEQSETLSANILGYKPSDLEKDIYRLSQLGIIVDWIVEDFFRGIYTVEINKNITISDVAGNLTATIKKYSSEQAIRYENRVSGVADTCNFQPIGKGSELQLIELATILLDWNYNQFVWTRRKSLQNLYEACLGYEESKKGLFKKALEDAFTVNDLTYFVREIFQESSHPEGWLDILSIEEPNAVELIIQNMLICDNIDDDVPTIFAQLQRFEETTGQSSFLSFVMALCHASQNDEEKTERDLSVAFTQIREYYDLLPRTCINLVHLVEKAPDTFKELVATEISKEGLDWNTLLMISQKIEHPSIHKQVVSKACDKLQKISEKLKLKTNLNR